MKTVGCNENDFNYWLCLQLWDFGDIFRSTQFQGSYRTFSHKFGELLERATFTFSALSLRAGNGVLCWSKPTPGELSEDSYVVHPLDSLRFHLEQRSLFDAAILFSNTLAYYDGIEDREVEALVVDVLNLLNRIITTLC